MTTCKAIAAAVLVLASAAAHAHGVRFGFAFGFPIYPAPYYYGPPAYYHPAPVYLPSGPVYVVPPTQSVPAPQPEHFWYYCPDSNAYHPYVKSCAGAWQRVRPQPPG